MFFSEVCLFPRFTSSFDILWFLKKRKRHKNASGCMCNRQMHVHEGAVEGLDSLFFLISTAPRPGVRDSSTSNMTEIVRKIRVNLPYLPIWLARQVHSIWLIQLWKMESTCQATMTIQGAKPTTQQPPFSKTSGFFLLVMNALFFNPTHSFIPEAPGKFSS